jgi:hypothetical protein
MPLEEKSQQRYFPISVRKQDHEIIGEISEKEDLPMKYVFGIILRDWLQSHPDRKISFVSEN